MKTLHSDLSKATSELSDLDFKIANAVLVSDRLLELLRERKKIVGDAYLNGSEPDVSNLDVLILNAQGAKAALVELKRQRNEKEITVKQIETALNAATSKHFQQIFEESICMYERVLPRLREAMIALSASAGMDSNTGASASRQAVVNSIIDLVSALPKRGPSGGWIGSSGLLYSMDISEDVKISMAEMRLSLYL